MKVDKGALEVVGTWAQPWQNLFSDLFHEAMEDMSKEDALEWAFNLCVSRRYKKSRGWHWQEREDGWWKFGPPKESDGNSVGG